MTTPPVVDERALEAFIKALDVFHGALWGGLCRADALREGYKEIQAYLAHVPQPDLHKLIAQMEGMKVRMDFWSDEDFKSYSPNETIDRCIALVRGMMKNEA